MRTKFDLNLLVVLDALLTTGSVSAAAQALDMTQSAVSHALRRLRTHFNDPLLVRAGNKMLATPRLLNLQPLVRATLDTLDAQLHAATFSPERSTRRFTISATDLSELLLLPAVIRELRIQAPHCKLRVVTMSHSEAQAALESGDVDILIGRARDGLHQQDLLAEGYVSVACKSHYPDLSILEDEAQFLALPHIAISPYGEDEDIYEWLFQKAGARRRFAVTIRSFLAAALIVRGTDLIATVPRPLPIQLDIQADRLHIIQPPVALPISPLRQVWHPRFHEDPANMWLRRLIASIFQPSRPPKGYEYKS